LRVVRGVRTTQNTQVVREIAPEVAAAAAAAAVVAEFNNSACYRVGNERKQRYREGEKMNGRR